MPRSPVWAWCYQAGWKLEPALGRRLSCSPNSLKPSPDPVMLSFNGNLRVYVALESCDMRKSFNGLSTLVSEKLEANPLSGAAFLFGRRGDSWTQSAYLKASNAEAHDRFGYSVAVDGRTLAISAVTEASASTGVDGDQHDNSADDSGAVYIFDAE